ncbi:LysR family transcriptional regulator [Ideonella dechloratans]|uniref:LysR family transcriptional regulator n=1 Tax=Ideonella dechloratans TaxID=36863 RepID=UPI0035B31C42
MDALDQMRAFVRVAEQASFTRAAQALGWPRATVTLAVQGLEARLGTQLLHRTTRRVHLTEDGQSAYERCLELLDGVDDLGTLFRPATAPLTGRLRVDMPSALVVRLLSRLPEFLRQHPDLQVEFSANDQRVDLVREGFDCLIRVGHLQDSTLVARPIGQMRQLNAASPAYLAAHGVPHQLDDLRQGHCLVRYAVGGHHRPAAFEYLDAQGQTQELTLPHQLTVNSADAYQAGCLAGLGIIQAPESGLRPLMETGRLVEILPGWRAPSMPVNFLYASRRHLPRRVQFFMDWAAEILSSFAYRIDNDSY